MPCYRPIAAWQCEDKKLVFAATATRAHGGTLRQLEIACGQCIGCRLERSRQWAVRCMHEAQLHELNSFITLTYADNQVPAGNSLNHRDFQLFMKRLRKHFKGQKIRFYMCGEYGETFSRPHFHACLFGIDFLDKEPITKLASQAKLFRSATLERLWPHGYSTVGAVTFESAAYIARYVMKKITGDQAKPHYTWIDENGEITEREPEYNKMSLKPGIGAAWLDQYHQDVYPSDQVITRGHAAKPPRYYDTRYHDKINSDTFEAVQLARIQEQRQHAEDNSDERLKTKETVTRAKINHLKRTIE